jgi:hypothetical protein
MYYIPKFTGKYYFHNHRNAELTGIFTLIHPEIIVINPLSTTPDKCVEV